jgi:hypothetical protein
MDKTAAIMGVALGAIAKVNTTVTMKNSNPGIKNSISSLFMSF